MYKRERQRRFDEVFGWIIVTLVGMSLAFFILVGIAALLNHRF